MTKKTAAAANHPAKRKHGPFVLSAAGTEFAGGTDESNIAEAAPEPFPKV